MPKYNATFAASVRAYATVTVEAADEDAAHARFKELAAAMADGGGDWPAEACNARFDPDWEQLDEIEYLDDCGIDNLSPVEATLLDKSRWTGPDSETV